MANHAPGHPNLQGHSPLNARKPHPPSQASGQAAAPLGAGEGAVANADRAIHRAAGRAGRAARNVGNALLPGNPFGG